VRPKVVVLTHAELARVVADNPFPEEPNPRWVHAIFRNGPLAARLLRLGGSRTAEPAGTARNWATVNKLLALCGT
jgi:uncharacterized protein (DUF1697 family)